MTKQELRSLIREEIKKTLKEANSETFTFSGVKSFMSFKAIPVFKKHGIDVTKIKKSYDPDSGTTEITVSMDAKTAEKIGRELEKLDKVGESFGGYIQEGKTRTLKEEVNSTNPTEIKKYFTKNKTGIYVYPGEVKRGFEKATPVFYTSNLRTNFSKLINDMEKQYPKYNTFTIVDIDQYGNMDIVTS